jgi:hypothetical protein
MERKQRLIGVALTVALMMSPGVVAEDAKTQRAVEAATKWLVLVDDGEYGTSWKEASDYLRKVMPKEQWETQFAAVREALGAVVSRKVVSTEYLTSLPGAPDGEYVVIQFETSFEHKQEAVETVTPRLEGDGNWRVSGYYIK